jgi:hypothetical protein
MEILLILGLVALVALPLHLLNRRDADKLEIEAAINADPRLRVDLMCARDYEERAVISKSQDAKKPEEADELPQAA